MNATMKRSWIILTALAAACTSAVARLDPPVLQEMTIPPGLTVAAHVAPDSQGVPAGYLDFTNPSSAAIELVFGACAFAVQLSDGDAAAPRWQSVPPGPRPCIMIARTLSVPAGTTVSVQAGRFAPSEGVSAPPRGQHRAAALFNGGVLRRVPAGTIDIP